MTSSVVLEIVYLLLVEQSGLQEVKYFVFLMLGVTPRRKHVFYHMYSYRAVL